MSFGNTVKDGSGTSYWLLQDADGRLIIADGFDTVSVQSDVTDNDSDKTFTVPASTEWIVKAISITLATSADVGNRQLSVLFTDGSDVRLFEMRPGAVQAASVTRYYQLAPNLPDLTSFRDTDLLTTPIPDNIVLAAGYKVRIYDKAAIAAAADDMHVKMFVGVR